MIRKFPITSETGNTYRIDFFEENWKRGFKFNLYEPYKWWFGITRFNLVDSSLERLEYFDYATWGGDYISMAKHTVKRYEDELARQTAHKNNVSDNVTKFNKWDGNCN